jgi:hypothetical protein
MTDKQVFRLTDSSKTRAAIIEAILNAPVGHVVTVAPETKQRTLPQNKLQWAELLGEVARQAWVNGRLFDEDCWHDLFKRQFMPDSEQEGITLPGYVKWKELPDGTLKCVASTTKLTKLGMTNYLNECYAYAAQELGVRFYVKENGG